MRCPIFPYGVININFIFHLTAISRHLFGINLKLPLLQISSYQLSKILDTILQKFRTWLTLPALLIYEHRNHGQDHISYHQLKVQCEKTIYSLGNVNQFSLIYDSDPTKEHSHCTTIMGKHWPIHSSLKYHSELLVCYLSLISCPLYFKATNKRMQGLGSRTMHSVLDSGLVDIWNDTNSSNTIIGLCLTD